MIFNIGTNYESQKKTIDIIETGNQFFDYLNGFKYSREKSKILNLTISF